MRWQAAGALLVLVVLAQGACGDTIVTPTEINTCSNSSKLLGSLTEVRARQARCMGRHPRGPRSHRQRLRGRGSGPSSVSRLYAARLPDPQAQTRRRRFRECRRARVQQ